tara:strand:- start:649 stop:888 length:240 start_codon:yes stop_codon:yes gene_type:complete
MANTRELSQLGSYIEIDDVTKEIGIAVTTAPNVGIGTTNPAYKLDVYGSINSNTDVKVNGVSITSAASGDATALAIALG